MIEITGKTIDDQTLTFQNILSLNYDSDRFIPCDSLDFTATMQFQNIEFYEITVYSDSNILFEGIVDKSEVILSSKGLLRKFMCRNKTALMIDNEVKPNIYSRLTSTQLFDIYARPFGVIKCNFPYNATQWLLQVKKGSSNWTVIEGYCHLNYHTVPYINHQRILTLSPFNDTIHIIGNSKIGALPYEKMNIVNDYHKLISRLYMKTATETYTYYYGVVFDNQEAIRRKVKRERYYHPKDIRQYVGTGETERVINNSSRDFFSVIVTLPSFNNIHVGDCIEIHDDNYSNKNLYVSSVNLKANDTSGLLTTLILRDKKYLK